MCMCAITFDFAICYKCMIVTFEHNKYKSIL